MPSPSRLLLGLTLSALLLGGCGPTDQEVAVALFTSIALVVPIATAVNAGLHRLWRDTRDLLAPSLVEAVAVCGAAAAIAAGVNTAVLNADDELVLFGLWLAGTSYLALFSLAVGVALWRRARWVFRGLYWAPAVLMMGLLAPIVADDNLSSSYNKVVFVVVTYAGGLGVVGGGLFVALLIVSIRTFRRSKNASAGGS
ncbi:MAG: hypothetical protein AB8I08_19925 [Sandaracinaceae bacterium]